MNQCSLFDVSDNYTRFVNDLIFILNHYKKTKAIYNQVEIADYIFSRLKYYNLL